MYKRLLKLPFQNSKSFLLLGPRGTGTDLKNLKAFKEDYPIAKLYLIYGGDRREYYGDIEVIPFVEAIKSLPALLD